MYSVALRFPRNSSLMLTATALLLGGRTDAEVVSILPSQDNTLFQSANGDQSSGLGESIFAGRTGFRNDFRIRRGTIAFDVAAAIPTNAMITDVTLRLFLEDAGQNASGTTVSLHTLNASWGEGTSVGLVGNPGVASIGDATWLHRFYDTASWFQPGGDFDPQPSAGTSISFASQFYQWSGSGLLDDVTQWLANPASNFGWILTGEEGDVTTALRFDSRESSITANRPQLTVTYTVPEPATFALFASGLLFCRSWPARGPARTRPQHPCT
jgi:hypothetical protein